MHKLPNRLRKEKATDPSQPASTEGMQLVCDGCGCLLSAPGGLMFGVPNERGTVHKYHLCSAQDNGCAQALKMILYKMASKATGYATMVEGSIVNFNHHAAGDPE